MDRIAANRATVEGQDALNSRPLPNLIGHNGPYFGTVPPIEQDAARIEGHSPLFRNLDTFEDDLRSAVLRTWDMLKNINRIAAEFDAGEETAEELIAALWQDFHEAFRMMQEALLIAEVLDDRQERRIRDRRRSDFLDLVSKTPREDMSALECLAEEGRLNWQIAHLKNRLAVVAKSLKQGQWSEAYLQEVFEAVKGLSLTPPNADALQAMNDNELAAELHELEERARDTRRTIALIHAIRTVRHA